MVSRFRYLVAKFDSLVSLDVVLPSMTRSRNERSSESNTGGPKIESKTLKTLMLDSADPDGGCLEIERLEMRLAGGFAFIGSLGPRNLSFVKVGPRDLSFVKLGRLEFIVKLVNVAWKVWTCQVYVNQFLLDGGFTYISIPITSTVFLLFLHTIFFIENGQKYFGYNGKLRFQRR